MKNDYQILISQAFSFSADPTYYPANRLHELLPAAEKH